MNLIQAIINKEVPYGIWEPDGGITKGPLKLCPSHICSGSFNPLHDTHRAYARYVREHFPSDQYLYYEISVSRIEKEDLTEEELLRRIKQFQWFAPVIVTNAPFFFDKGELFRLASFHMGYDSAIRMLRDHPIHEIESQTNVYYVHDRDGQSITDLNEKYVPANMFAVHSNFPPLSSTEIRNRSTLGGDR